MLFKNRQYVIDEIKTPLMKAIVELSKCGSRLGMLIALIQIIRIAKKYPQPTKDHTLLPRTHILIDIQDKFFEHEDNPGRDALFRAIWRMFIVEYEHDPYYRARIDWVINEIKSNGWGDELIKTSTKCWKE